MDGRWNGIPERAADVRLKAVKGLTLSFDFSFNSCCKGLWSVCTKSELLINLWFIAASCLWAFLLLHLCSVVSLNLTPASLHDLFSETAPNRPSAITADKTSAISLSKTNRLSSKVHLFLWIYYLKVETISMWAPLMVTVWVGAVVVVTYSPRQKTFDP